MAKVEKSVLSTLGSKLESGVELLVIVADTALAYNTLATTTGSVEVSVMACLMMAVILFVLPAIAGREAAQGKYAAAGELLVGVVGMVGLLAYLRAIDGIVDGASQGGVAGMLNSSSGGDPSDIVIAALMAVAMLLTIALRFHGAFRPAKAEYDKRMALAEAIEHYPGKFSVDTERERFRNDRDEAKALCERQVALAMAYAYQHAISQCDDADVEDAIAERIYDMAGIGFRPNGDATSSIEELPANQRIQSDAQDAPLIGEYRAGRRAA